MSTAITSVVAVDLLKGIILKFPSSVYCFAYGSAIFAQKNQKMGKMVDLVFVVDNPLKWHTENLRLNPNHYSFLKYFGPKTIVKVQENWACGVYYNTLVNVDNQLLKYGVISTHKAMDDLKTWTHVYISGRLQKPVRDLVPPTNSQLVKYIKQNRLSALRAALLQLPQYSTKFELYHTITELSYIGDSRMAVSENPNKVQNIVAANISGFDEIYQPLVKELHPLIEATFDDMIVQDMSSDARLKHLMALPFHLQRDISRKSGRNPALCDIEDSLVELSSLPSLGPLVRKSLADIVWKSSIQQTVQGVLTAGLFKAIKYGTEKVKKKITGSSETTLPRVLRPNITSDEVYKLEMLKEKNREDEITAFKTITLTNPAEKQIEDKSLQNNLKEAEVSSPSESQSPTLSDLELPFALKSSLSETSITKTQGFITFTVKDQTELLKPKVSGIPPILVHKLGETLPSPLHPKDEKIKVKPPEKSTPQSSTGVTDMATASEIDDFDASTLQDLSCRGLPPDSSNLSSIAEERNGDQRDIDMDMDMQCNRQIKMYRARHCSIGNTTLERNSGGPGLRKSMSPYASFEDATDVYGIIQLNVLKVNTMGIDIGDPYRREWKEIARWIKYEQDLEEGADRLGRPHIAPLAFHFIMRLNYVLEKNAIALLDLEEKDMAGVASRVTEVLIATGLIQPDEVSSLMEDLLLKQRLAQDRDKGGFVSKLANTVTDGLFEEPRSVEPSPPASTERRMSSKPRNIILRKMAFANRSMSFQFQQRRGSESDVGAETEEVGKSPKETFFSSDSISKKRRSSLQLVLQASAESTIIMVRGEYKRRKGAFIFVRLAEAVPLSDVSMIPTPTRMIAIILAPTGSEEEFVEMGRSFGTLMSNRRFNDTTLNATNTKDILAGINEFLHESIVLPPGEWYTHDHLYDLLPQHELETKNKIIQRQKYKASQKVGLQHYGDSGDGIIPEQFVVELRDIEKDEIPGPFVRTGKPFGGLVNDIRRRYPRYKADFLDGLSLQCLAATIFLYFASIAHNVTFGGLLASKTNGFIGVPETLVAATVAGVIFALFSGQPLLPIAPTAPLLLFDEILYQFLERNEIEFLPARTWIGLWVLIISIIYVGFEGSVITKNFTRFTQETFAALISVVFVYESFTSLYNVYKDHPLNPSYNETYNPWVRKNESKDEDNSDDVLESTSKHHHSLPKQNQPNTALLSTFLMFGTFFIGFTLKKMRASQLFGEKIRNTLSDFSVPIAIFIMVTLDMCTGVFTTKINVPTGFQTTRPSARSWFIPPWGILKSFDPWVPVITLLPGTLVFILMSMTLEICELILGERDKLDKGNGFHLDVLILGVINFGSGLFGFPWLSCATLKALAHCTALTVYSRNNPPGSPPVVVEIIQERLTALVMSIMIGLSILVAPLLKHVSMSVLFGVFLYMGITSLLNTQFYERMLLFLIPTHLHPPVVYVRRVPTWKIHLFTLIQIGCIVLLWVVKSIKAIALTFPFIIMLLVPIRINLRYIFTQNELDALDGKSKPAAPTPEKPMEKTA